ncbi:MULTISPECIES: CxxxxCH/CxxCH domain-containing protein [unclassified Pseudomonas]|uniref:CxxxxCH/CxxCH domain-containing protein n=1 Tax=Pseudomonas sp. FW305-3-2-15-E-TSA4 TaxID=2259621 RepID=UPI0011AF5604
MSCHSPGQKQPCAWRQIPRWRRGACGGSRRCRARWRSSGSIIDGVGIGFGDQHTCSAFFRTVLIPQHPATEGGSSSSCRDQDSTSSIGRSVRRYHHPSRAW